MQFDLFTDVIEPERIEAWPIASRDDILKLQTAIAFDPRVKPEFRLKATELICKMQGYFTKEPESQEPPQPVQIIFTEVDARIEPPTDTLDADAA